MCVVESGESIIKNVKINDDGSKLRITFDWPVGVQQVYVFASSLDIFDIHHVNLTSDGKLFTLQEYKKLGGYVTEKNQGEMHYYIYPFIREDGKDILVNQPETSGNSVKFIDKTMIRCQIREKSRWSKYKNYEITLEANYPVQEKILCYVKKKNEPPRDISDGTLYYWNDTINSGQTVRRIVRTLKNEHMRMFVRDEVMYGIV